MAEPHPVLARLPEGIELRQQGRRAEARALMEQLWSEVAGPTGDPVARCAVAHSLADAQDDVHDELRWDLAALAAARSVTDEEVAAAGMDGSAAALLPSLHLNLADCYRRTGQLDDARDHLARGAATVEQLPAGEYGDMIRAALRDLADRLDR